MRPITLTMSAFGPYADRVVVELDKLGESGVYLITGDTGAGKTTIFDGIIYALYGEPSGNNRDDKMLRSRYASPETPTEVELVFECRAKAYKVWRSPEYERPKARGEGTTKHATEACLTMPDGSVITKIADVTAQIEQIIGINREQFMQIAMIAQGDFLKLLFASTKERIEIFRHLFKTEPYRQLQEKLKELKGALDAKCTEARRSIEQYIGEIMVDGDSALSVLLSSAKNGEMPVCEIIELIHRILSEDADASGRLSEQMTELEASLDTVKKALAIIETQRKNTLELKATSELIDIKTARLVTLKTTLDEAMKGKTALEALSREITTIENDLPKYTELSAEKSELEAIFGEIESRSAKKIKAQNQRDKLTADIATLTAEAEDTQSIPQKKQELIGQRAELVAQKTTLRDILDKLDALEKEIEALTKAQKKFLELQRIYLEADEEYKRKHSAFLREQAGILALGLEDGMPCPVCGSLSHPKKATTSEGAPSEAELNLLEKRLNEERDNAQASSKTAAEQKRTVELLEADVIKALATLSINKIEGAADKLFAMMQELDAKIADTDALISECDSKIKRLEQIRELLPKLQGELEMSREQISALEAQISALEAKKQSAIKRIASLSSALKLESEALARARIDELRESAKKITEQIDNATEAYLECEREITALKAKIEELTRQLRDSRDIDEDAELAKKAELEAQRIALVEKSTQISVRLETNRRLLSEIEKRSHELISLEEEYQMVRSLSDTANGSLSGKEKIMLETYIQMTYFDRIIVRANRRLMIMSAGQYELKRRRDGTKNKQGGLDLDVIDHYNGTHRDVKSLSGGESFKASLSLALGLSDEIQSTSGGVRLDTMFVDEGFGSLDEESLEQAMRALYSLADGKRLVGIISHVRELKEKIGKQIIVTKSKTSGSSVKIVTD